MISQHALARARAALKPRADVELDERVAELRLDLDPEYARAVEARYREDRAYANRYAVGARGRGLSGWRKGTPQCPGCRRILQARDGYCPNCGTLAGRYEHGR